MDDTLSSGTQQLILQGCIFFYISDSVINLSYQKCKKDQNFPISKGDSYNDFISVTQVVKLIESNTNRNTSMHLPVIVVMNNLNYNCRHLGQFLNSLRLY